MSKRNLHDLTDLEINAIVFEGATSTEPRGLRDRLTDDEIISLADHPANANWPTSWKDWIWSTIDTIIEEAA